MEVHRKSKGCSTYQTRGEHRSLLLRCAAPGCRCRLSLSTRLLCGRCHKFTCMQHRYADDHVCGASPASATVSRLVVSRDTPAKSGASSGPASAVAASPHPDLQHDRGPEGQERCPTCGSVLPSIGLLIEHCEQWHIGTAIRALS
jgi:hypothetical protein